MMDNLSSKNIALLLMAAGSSSRLGRPKQFVNISSTDVSNQSLLCRQVNIMNKVCGLTNASAYCVLGYQYEEMSQHLADNFPRQQLQLIENRQWSQGLSCSIAKGISALKNDIDAVLIFLVDQWQLSAENLSRLIHQWQQQPEFIYIASNHKSTSPPVIFPRNYFNDLLALTGDKGAKKIIENNINKTHFVEMKTAFSDLDTPEQLEYLNQFNHLTSKYN